MNENGKGYGFFNYGTIETDARFECVREYDGLRLASGVRVSSVFGRVHRRCLEVVVFLQTEKKEAN